MCSREQATMGLTCANGAWVVAISSSSSVSASALSTLSWALSLLLGQAVLQTHVLLLVLVCSNTC